MASSSSSPISSLFPISVTAGFTTSTDIHLPTNVQHVALSDEGLGVHKVTGRTTHNIVTPPIPPPGSSHSSTLSWEASYPLGSINPSAEIPGGFNFYLDAGAQFKSCSSHTLGSYRVLFEEGFDWVKGGKLPGLCK